MNNIQPLGLLLGRVLLAYIFVVAGFGKIGRFSDTAAYMASKGLPISEVLLVATIVIELIGGLMIALGWKARWAALAIFVFLIPTTLVFHAFWAVDPEQVRAQTIQFNKNLAIMGGMLYIAIVGSGRYGLDRGS
ncbi:MAG: DoxX family protein [Acidiferrobacterales bacterium]|nr:DoxX family protein [Acidiferrobacterales bacterium]